MDRTSPGGFNLNEAILTLDLSGHPDADFAFFHKSVGDESDTLPASFVGSFNGDGVSISDDGNAWHTLVSLNSANSPNNVYTGFEFDLDYGSCIGWHLTWIQLSDQVATNGQRELQFGRSRV